MRERDSGQGAHVGLRVGVMYTIRCNVRCLILEGAGFDTFIVESYIHIPREYIMNGEKQVLLMAFEYLGN